MLSIRSGLLCTLLLSAVHLTLLGEEKVKTAGADKRDNFHITFEPLPSFEHPNAKKCDWCEAKLKHLELEKIDLTEALNSAESDCDESQEKLVKQLRDLQAKYQKLFEAYTNLKNEKKDDNLLGESTATAEFSDPNEPNGKWKQAFDHCLDKIASHGWTCHDAAQDSDALGGPEAPVTASPNIPKPAQATDADLEAVKKDLAKKSADFDALLEDKNKLLEDYKNLKAELDKKNHEPVSSPALPVDDAAKTDKTLNLKISTLEADLRGCLESKNKYTSFIADLNSSLAGALKDKEQCEKDLKDSKAPSTAIHSESAETAARDQQEVNHASVWIGGRSH